MLVVDFRSDTVTKPDAEMREAMSKAEVGDDVYGEDPTVNELQSYTAELLGKEAGLFVPSGTMANLIALLVHCPARGSEAIVGDESHILIYEQTGAAQFGGINLRSVRNLADGSLDLGEVREKVRARGDVHQSVSALLCLENTHNRRGGRCLPPGFAREAGRLCAELGLAMHLDGARIFNAACALGTSARELAAPFDSVSVCLSKGLGAPVGSVLVGSAEFIARARRVRKALGGGMRQAGVLAAAGLVAIKKGPARAEVDHALTKRLGAFLASAGAGLVSVDLAATETNILFVEVPAGSAVASPEWLAARLRRVEPGEREALAAEVTVLANQMNASNVRIVVHKDISERDVELAEKKFAFIFSELRR